MSKRVEDPHQQSNQKMQIPLSNETSVLSNFAGETQQLSTDRTDKETRVFDDDVSQPLNEISIINNSEEVNVKPKTVTQLPKLHLNQGKNDTSGSIKTADSKMSRLKTNNSTA